MRRPDAPWQIIVPLNQAASPFRLRGDEMDPADAVIDRVRVERLDESVAGPSKAGDSRFAIGGEAGGVTGVDGDS